MNFDSEFLCKFVAVRKIFFKSFLKNHNTKDLPKEITKEQLCDDDKVTLEHLKQVEQVMKGELKDNSIEFVENMDRVVN
jgi:hypothetical protein